MSGNSLAPQGPAAGPVHEPTAAQKPAADRGNLSQSDVLERLVRPLAVAAMLMCMAIAAGQFIATLAPKWPQRTFALLTFVVALEAIYSERILSRRDYIATDKLRFRFVEWVIILLFARLFIYFDHGYERLLTDLARWSLNVGALFDVEFIAIALFMALFWGLAGFLSQTMSELEASPIEHMPAVTDPHHYLRSTMPHHGRVDRGLRLARITNVFWMGGVFILIFAGLARVQVQDLIVFRHARSSGPVLNVLTYFVMGLLIISHAQYTILKANWDLQDIPVIGHVGQHWVLLVLAFLLLIGLVSALLPVSYSVGILETAGLVIRWIIYIVIQAVFLILFALSYLLGLFLSLFSGGKTPAPAPMARPAPPPPPPAAAAADPNPWWAVIRSLIFWTILIGVVGYSFVHYARDRWGWFKGASWARLSAWVRSLWARVRRSALRAGHALQERISRALRGRGSPTRPSQRFISFRRLSPRDRVRYFYLSVLARSARLGFGRGRGQTPQEYEQILLRELPDASDDIRALTKHFVEARYTEHDVNRDRARQAQTVWQKVKRMLTVRRKQIQGARDGNPSPPAAGS